MRNVNEELLFEHLDNALENDYNDLLDWNPHDVANDITAFDVDFETYEPESLVSYIEEWQNVRRQYSRCTDFVMVLMDRAWRLDLT